LQDRLQGGNTEGDRHIETSKSLAFPKLSLTELIPLLVQQAIKFGTSKMLRSLKAQLKSE